MLKKVAKVIGAFMIVLLVHEGGHAVVAMAQGVPVHELGFGFGPGPTITNVPFVEKIHFGIIPLGAYVEVDREQLAKLGFWGYQSFIIGGMLATVLLAAGLMSWQSKNILGSLRQAFIGWFRGPEPLPGMQNGFYGPISIGKLIANAPVPYSTVLIWLCLLIAQFNLLPILPLDGGRMVLRTLELFLSPEVSILVSLGLSCLVIVWLMLGSFILRRFAKKDESEYLIENLLEDTEALIQASAMTGSIIASQRLTLGERERTVIKTKLFALYRDLRTTPDDQKATRVAQTNCEINEYLATLR